MLTRREEGQGMVEYALLIVLISIAALVILLLIGPNLISIFSTVNSALSGT